MGVYQLANEMWSSVESVSSFIELVYCGSGYASCVKRVMECE